MAHDRDSIQLMSMYVKPVKPSDIRDIILALDNNKQTGIDGIRVVDLKYIVNELAPIIARCIYLRIKFGKLSEILKLAIIRPIYKKGSHLM